MVCLLLRPVSFFPWRFFWLGFSLRLDYPPRQSRPDLIAEQRRQVAVKRGCATGIGGIQNGGGGLTALITNGQGT
jgi:hypothetical protein